MKTIGELAKYLEDNCARLRVVSPRASDVRAWCASITSEQSYGSGVEDDLEAALREAVTNFESTKRHEASEVNGYEKPTAVTDERHEK